jgi:predicted TIM-barrel fold metal-dependent hydrolase
VHDYSAYVGGAWRDLFTRVHARGWHVEVFVDTGRLPEVAASFDGSHVAVVFDHFGGPGRERASVDATFAAVRRLCAEREVWCKFSGPYRVVGDPKDHAARWLDAVGPSRLVWGSDWPWTGFEDETSYRAVAARLREWIDPALESAVLWDNAARLYGFA